MWGDEMQAWALARNASSLSQLYYNLRYEGNPGLFHLFLFVASRFTDNYFFLKYFTSNKVDGDNRLIVIVHCIKIVLPYA